MMVSKMLLLFQGCILRFHGIFSSRVYHLKPFFLFVELVAKPHRQRRHESLLHFGASVPVLRSEHPTVSDPTNPPERRVGWKNREDTKPNKVREIPESYRIFQPNPKNFDIFFMEIMQLYNLFAWCTTRGGQLEVLQWQAWVQVYFFRWDDNGSADCYPIWLGRIISNR